LQISKHNHIAPATYAGGVKESKLILCAIQQRLLTDSVTATLAFNDAVKALQPYVGSEEFSVFMNDVWNAGEECRLAREALESHRADHGC
jgi:hypothetical protein